ncbi:MAG TPA: helix-turn-helix transcriptional regulator [Phototrophicaceae bacterium]|nr:helix-turn-helix transcriptional regulator [Phototrophicaceae bacterium]
MDFKDAAARLRSKKDQHEEGMQPKEPDFNESYQVRGKMIGVLLRDARLHAARSLEECAFLLKVTPAEVEAWEFGERVPSLPQLELMAYYLGVPISHFWGTNTLEATQGRHIDIQTEYMALRDRMVGALLRQAREEQQLSLEEVSQTCAVSLENLNRYEAGEVPVPMHELSVMAGMLKKNLSYFLESSGHIGNWLAIREEWKHFTNLPEDLRQFAAKPINIGFIEIALMLSQMPADKLRRVGESVLDITR